MWCEQSIQKGRKKKGNQIAFVIIFKCRPVICMLRWYEVINLNEEIKIEARLKGANRRKINIGINFLPGNVLHFWSDAAYSAV